jgi:hypothetical protein
MRSWVGKIWSTKAQTVRQKAGVSELGELGTRRNQQGRHAQLVSILATPSVVVDALEAGAADDAAVLGAAVGDVLVVTPAPSVEGAADEGGATAAAAAAAGAEPNTTPRNEPGGAASRR